MAKKVSDSAVTGELGVTLIARRVGEMCFVWHPRAIDAGIDGEIELRDPKTRVALNLAVLVQSKARKTFPGETADAFHYFCDRNDIEYWVASNIPVILVCSHPETQEAWWCPVREWFKDPARRESRRVDFNKHSQRFDVSSREQVLTLSVTAGTGIVLPPLHRREVLITNLLQIEQFPTQIFRAKTTCRRPLEIYNRLRGHGVQADDWILRDKQIYSFRSLANSPMASLCEEPPESFQTGSWADSEDDSLVKSFAALLKATLREMTSADLSWFSARQYLFFRRTTDLAPRKLTGGGRRSRGRTVFQTYQQKRDPTKIAFCRHAAVTPYFIRLEGIWHVELVPTYHFTYNGNRESKWSYEYLANIKRREGHKAVLDQVRMWARYLSDRKNLLSERDEPLRFGQLLQLEVERGINDKAWAKPKLISEQPIAQSSLDGVA